MEKKVDIFVTNIFKKNNFTLFKSDIIENFKLFLAENKSKDRYLERIISIIKSLTTEKQQIYLASVLLYISPTSKYIDFLIELTNKSSLSKEYKYFIFHQIFYKLFINNNLRGINTFGILLKFYKNIYDTAINDVKKLINIKFIPKDERNKKLIFVLTSQYISINHAPTRRTLVKCINLKELGYDVVLINTCSLATKNNGINFYDLFLGSYSEDYFNIDCVKFKDYSIPFYQMKDMYKDSEVVNIIKILQKYKPYLILEIGATNIIADICDSIIPVVTISASMGLPISMASFRIASSKVDKKDVKLLKQYSISKRSLIIHKLKFSMIALTEDIHNTKNKLGIPEDKFILLFVGARLTSEVSDEFIIKLLKLRKLNIHILLVGGYDKYEENSKRIKYFKQNVTYLSSQSNMASIYKNSDLYVNPPYRQGGGASSIESLYCGIPVVSINHGDVYINIGKKFVVNDISEMITMIKKYILDSQYYRKMSKVSKKRAKKLIDSKKDTKELLNKIISNKLFF